MVAKPKPNKDANLSIKLRSLWSRYIFVPPQTIRSTGTLRSRRTALFGRKPKTDLDSCPIQPDPPTKHIEAQLQGTRTPNLTFVSYNPAATTTASPNAKVGRAFEQLITTVGRAALSTSVEKALKESLAAGVLVAVAPGAAISAIGARVPAAGDPTSPAAPLPTVVPSAVGDGVITMSRVVVSAAVGTGEAASAMGADVTAAAGFPTATGAGVAAIGTGVGARLVATP